jgi:hypothetical protein
MIPAPVDYSNGEYMGLFKPSFQRKCFIDKKIREHSYPTAVSLAADYAKEYGKKLDPRTFAADIAEMKQDFQAPISYDYQNRGYFYTDPGFTLAVLPGNSEIPLPIASEIHSRTAFLPEWQRNLLSGLVEKVLPLPQKPSPLFGKVSILPDERQGEDIINPVKKTIFEALGDNSSLQIVYNGFYSASSNLVFKPLHCILSRETLLVFGLIEAEGRYTILYLDRIGEAIHLNKTLKPPAYVYVQTTHHYDIEVILSKEESDLFLVFSAKRRDAKKKIPGEYVLLAQIEIFAPSKLKNS